MNIIIINKIKQQISKNREGLLLNHIYDMDDKWLFSVKTKEDSDLMDPYYIADKKTLKVNSFTLLNNLPKFNEALKHKVY